MSKREIILFFPVSVLFGVAALHIVTLFSSCGAKQPEYLSAGERTDSLTISKSNQQEDFDEFFHKFTTDSLFQIERVNFPWRVQIATEYGETVEETVKDDWKHSTFYYEESFAKREEDAYTQKIKNCGDTVRLEIRGVDNGLFVDYNFVMDDGKWILVSGKDYSD